MVQREECVAVSDYLRILLLVVPLLSFVAVLHRIRKSQMKIEDAVSWILLACLLVLMGVFPQAIVWLARVVGVESPANLVFLIIIFILLLKIFQLSIKVSKIEAKLEKFAQKYAIEQKGK